MVVVVMVGVHGSDHIRFLHYNNFCSCLQFWSAITSWSTRQVLDRLMLKSWILMSNYLCSGTPLQDDEWHGAYHYWREMTLWHCDTVTWWHCSRPSLQGCRYPRPRWLCVVWRKAGWEAGHFPLLFIVGAEPRRGYNMLSCRACQ